MNDDHQQGFKSEAEKHEDALCEERRERLLRKIDESLASARRHREAAEYWDAIARARGE